MHSLTLVPLVIGLAGRSGSDLLLGSGGNPLAGGGGTCEGGGVGTDRDFGGAGGSLMGNPGLVLWGLGGTGLGGGPDEILRCLAGEFKGLADNPDGWGTGLSGGTGLLLGGTGLLLGDGGSGFAGGAEIFRVLATFKSGNGFCGGSLFLRLRGGWGTGLSGRSCPTGLALGLDPGMGDGKGLVGGGLRWVTGESDRLSGAGGNGLLAENLRDRPGPGTGNGLLLYSSSKPSSSKESESKESSPLNDGGTVGGGLLGTPGLGDRPAFRLVLRAGADGGGADGGGADGGALVGCSFGGRAGGE